MNSTLASNLYLILTISTKQVWMNYCPHGMWRGHITNNPYSIQIHRTKPVKTTWMTIYTEILYWKILKIYIKSQVIIENYATLDDLAFALHICRIPLTWDYIAIHKETCPATFFSQEWSFPSKNGQSYTHAFTIYINKYVMQIIHTAAQVD